MNFLNVKCLVTGGASFIGSHLVERLLVEGARVRVADDLSSGRLANLDAVAEDIEFLEGDLRHMDFAYRATRDCQLVFHLAAAHGGRGYIATHPADCANNMALDNIVFQAAADSGVEQVVYTSSACVYPTDIQCDRQLLHESMASFTERGGAYADEEYGWAKLMGELSLRAYHRQYGLDAASARLSTAYGPRENESHALIALIAKALARQDPFEIWGSGEQTRGFTYVDDIVEGVLRAAVYIHDATVVNVGTDEFVSLNRIAETIFDVLGWRPVNGIHHDLDKPVGVQHRALDISHARARTGWYPETSLRHGIERTVEWYAGHRDIEDVTQNLQTLLMER